LQLCIEFVTDGTDCVYVDIGISVEEGIFVGEIEPGSAAAVDDVLGVGDRLHSVSPWFLDSEVVFHGICGHTVACFPCVQLWCARYFSSCFSVRALMKKGNSLFGNYYCSLIFVSADSPFSVCQPPDCIICRVKSSSTGMSRQCENWVLPREHSSCIVITMQMNSDAVFCMKSISFVSCIRDELNTLKQ